MLIDTARQFYCMVEGCNEAVPYYRFGCTDEHEAQAVEWLEQIGEQRYQGYQEVVAAGEPHLKDD